VRLLRWAGRLLDPWAALLLGVAVVLAVITLLAMPGPWREVVGGGPAGVAEPPPSDLAVFVQGREGSSRCTAAVWLHVEQERPALTAVVVPVQLQVFVADGGYAPIGRVCDGIDPAAAAAALGEQVGAPINHWVTLDGEALQTAVPTMFPSGESRWARRRHTAALDAWSGSGDAESVFRRQTHQLAAALPRLRFSGLTVVGAANYVLGSDHSATDLTLQQATGLARMLRAAPADRVWVRPLPVVKEERGEAAFWRVRRGPIERLAQSLSFGLAPPPTTSEPLRVSRDGGLAVVAPATIPHGDLDGFAAALAAAVESSAGVALPIETLRCGASLEKTVRALAATRPLAVALVVPPGAGERELGQLTACAGRLRRLGQPAVLVDWLPPGESDGSGVGPYATGLPVAHVGGSGRGDSSPPPPALTDWRRGGTRAALTLVRACWPEVLAPGLPATRLGVSYAQRRVVESAVVVVPGAEARAEAVLARLSLAGYRPEVLEGDEWRPPLPSIGVAYRPGQRRAALSLAGDLGRDAAEAMLDETSPAAVVAVP
jgi:hypothetical protein